MHTQRSVAWRARNCRRAVTPYAALSFAPALVHGIVAGSQTTHASDVDASEAAVR